MTTTVAIFDNARDLEKAVERLAAGGFEDTVYDEAIVAGEAGNVGTVSAPDSATGVLLRSVQPNLSPRPNRHAIVRAFRAHLADYRLSEEVIEAYATTFYHGGEFVLGRNDNEHAGKVIEILRECGATRVNKHD